MELHDRQTTGACFDLAHNLRGGKAVDSKRIDGVVKAKHEIHERSCIDVAA